MGPLELGLIVGNGSHGPSGMYLLLQLVNIHEAIVNLLGKFPLLPSPSGGITAISLCGQNFLVLLMSALETTP